MTTLAQITSFILRYRNGTKAFKDYKPFEVDQLLQSAVDANQLVVDIVGFGRVCGVIIFEFPNNQSVRVVSALCLTRDSTKRCIKRMIELYGKEYKTIEFRRRGVERIYNLNRLLRSYQNG